MVLITQRNAGRQAGNLSLLALVAYVLLQASSSRELHSIWASPYCQLNLRCAIAKEVWEMLTTCRSLYKWKFVCGLCSVRAWAAAASSLSLPEQWSVRGGREGRVGVPVSARVPGPSLWHLRSQAGRRVRQHGRPGHSHRDTPGPTISRSYLRLHTQEAFVSLSLIL